LTKYLTKYQQYNEEKSPMYLHLTREKKDALKVIAKQFNTTQTTLIEEALDNIIIEYGKKYKNIQENMNQFMV
tara:strand:+ start:759 stop:977 length:219 start_codon:yes stop_codon:yes gene_type:complete